MSRVTILWSKWSLNEINRNTRSTMHQLQMAWFHSKWCQFHQGKRVSSSGSGDLVDTSEGSAALKSTHLCCSWQLSQVLVRPLLGDFINFYLKVTWHWKQKLGLFSSEKKHTLCALISLAVHLGPEFFFWNVKTNKNSQNLIFKVIQYHSM